MSRLTDTSSGPAVTILPPRERFAAGEAGAIALLVQRLATTDEIVIGAPTHAPPFPGVCFLPVRDGSFLTARWSRNAFWPPFGLRSGPQRYAAAIARMLGSLGPSVVEIHNRPELAWSLRTWFPHIPMRLVLHNDPQNMRCAKTPSQRDALARRLAVVSVSDWIRDRYCEGTNLNPAQLCVLPNCLDLSTLPPARSVAEREQTILFAGRVVADKGADAFVAACAEVLSELPGWRAEMIGADRFGPGSPDTPFLSTLRPRAYAAGIAMTGYLPHEAVIGAMSRAAVTVVPSRWPEPFGLTALEAMACGSALIASPRGALAALAGDAALFADPDRPGDLARAIRRMATDFRLRERLTGLGYRRARTFDLQSARDRRKSAPAF